jgi:hypothetical protein
MPAAASLRSDNTLATTLLAAGYQMLALGGERSCVANKNIELTISI